MLTICRVWTPHVVNMLDLSIDRSVFRYICYNNCSCCCYHYHYYNSYSYLCSYVLTVMGKCILNACKFRLRFQFFDFRFYICICYVLVCIGLLWFSFFCFGFWFSFWFCLEVAYICTYVYTYMQVYICIDLYIFIWILWVFSSMYLLMDCVMV